jgi:hypothetical protein
MYAWFEPQLLPDPQFVFGRSIHSDSGSGGSGGGLGGRGGAGGGEGYGIFT